MRIDDVQVTLGCQYLVYGKNRGVVSKHRSLKQAEESLSRDIDRCRAANVECDAEIYQHMWGNTWDIVEENK